MHEKPEGVTRIALQNTNNLSLWVPPHKNMKMLNIKRFVRKSECDVIGITEHGTNLAAIERNRSLRSQLSSNTELRTVACHNKHDGGKEVKQWGGTAVAAFDHAATLVTDTGEDSSGLGRYCWIKIEGRTADGKSRATRIISATTFKTPTTKFDDS
mmetsp:Transcript_22597/g.49058  ORF Transcript_22597/g.49058 Transcript_22597/m.49058 type:complete len:156 (+) Transcript_22597:278-745(+)